MPLPLGNRDSHLFLSPVSAVCAIPATPPTLSPNSYISLPNGSWNVEVLQNLCAFNIDSASPGHLLNDAFRRFVLEQSRSLFCAPNFVWLCSRRLPRLVFLAYLTIIFIAAPSVIPYPIFLLLFQQLFFLPLPRLRSRFFHPVWLIEEPEARWALVTAFPAPRIPDPLMQSRFESPALSEPSLELYSR